MTLTKYEKETIILFNEGEDTAHIQTYNAGLRKRLAAFSKKHPDLCRLEKSFAQGTQTESKRECKANRVQEAGRNNVTVRGQYAVKMSGLHPMFLTFLY